MPELREAPVPYVSRSQGAQVRLWYGQPAVLAALGGPPWVPEYAQPPTGLDLLRSILAAESTQQGPRPGPTFVALPEYALRKEDIDTARGLIAGAPHNVVVVFGVGQLTEGEGLALENDPSLWDGIGSNRYTNCAIVGIGGTEHLYLQPKIIPSHWEDQRFLKGRVIRYFTGTNISFVVQICSDLLPQPGASSNSETIVSWIQDTNRRLSLLIWIQHNEKPRAPAFESSLTSLTDINTTIMTVSSRAITCRDKRYENHSVSGAVVQHPALPRYFYLLDKEFHYVEPVSGVTAASRAVLLRYDADAYRVQTVLSDSLTGAISVEKGAFSLIQSLIDSSREASARLLNIAISKTCYVRLRTSQKLRPSTP